MTPEVSLQHDMFTGELVDNRSAAQKRADRERQTPQQREMFSINEIVELMKPARHWLDDFPAPVLELEIQDIRTEEEKERDLRRAGEALTAPMFPVEAAPQNEDRHESTFFEPAASSLPEYSPPRVSRYLASRRVAAPEGLRTRLRRERVGVRTRHLDFSASEIVPTLWMERDYIQKRLPYLAEGISHLEDDELASLAESISEVLQETYWTVMGIVLVHLLDDEQGARTERTT